MLSHRKDEGFTLIELLVVIVVIGILATVSAVAYSGIQNRARTAAKETQTTTLKKKMELYAAINGQYPIYNTSDPAALASEAEITEMGDSVFTSQNDGGCVRYTPRMDMKSQVCLFSSEPNSYGILWYDDYAKLWRSYRHSLDGTTTERTYHDNNGRPNWPV